MRKNAVLVKIMVVAVVFAFVLVAMPVGAASKLPNGSDIQGVSPSSSDPPSSYGIGQLLATFSFDHPQCWAHGDPYWDGLWRLCGAEIETPGKTIEEVWPTTVEYFEFTLPSDGWIILEVEAISDDHYTGSMRWGVQKRDETGEWSDIGVTHYATPVPSEYWDELRFDENGNLRTWGGWLPEINPAETYQIFAWQDYFNWAPTYNRQFYFPAKGSIKVIFVPQEAEIPGTEPLDYSKGIEISYPDNTKGNEFSWPTDWPSGTEPMEFEFTDRDSFVFLPGGYIQSDQTGSVTIDKDSITLDKKVSDIPLQFSDMGAEVVIQQGRIEVIPYLHAPGEVLLAGGWNETAEKFMEEKLRELPYMIWENKGQIALSVAGGTFIKLTTGIPGWILTNTAKYGARLLGANWDHILKAIAKGEEETKKAGCPYGWNLSTATGHCLVKSECFIRTLDDGTTTIYVCEGDVEFSDVNDNKTVHINGGHTSTCEVGGLPSDPVPFNQDEVEELWKAGDEVENSWKTGADGLLDKLNTLIDSFIEWLKSLF